VGSIEILLSIGAFVIAVNEVLEPLLVDGADRLREISVDLWITEIEHIRLEVLKYPWKHRVLREVLEASLGVRVEQEKIIKVGHGSIDPLLGELNDRLFSCHARRLNERLH